MLQLLLTPPDHHPNEMETIRHLLGTKFHRLHLRKPHYTTGETREYLQQLGPLCCQTVLHHNHQLYREFPICGLHFNTTARLAGEVHQHTDFNGWRSSSFHRASEIINCTFPFDYGFISPVYDSISKPDYPARFSTDQLRYLNTHSPFPLIALGGITLKMKPHLSALGFKGLAVLGGVWH